jgi:hypothetical protein
MGNPATGGTAGRGRLWRAALSLVALIAIVLAVPVVLLSLGGPPFAHIDLGQLTRVAGAHRPYDPHLFVAWVARAALLLAWLSWAWMSLCVALELRARLTGRPSTRLPTGRTLQAVAACLVGTALAVTVAGRVGNLPGRPVSRTPTSVDATLSSLASLRVIDDLGPDDPWTGGAGMPGMPGAVGSAGAEDSTPTYSERPSAGLAPAAPGQVAVVDREMPSGVGPTGREQPVEVVTHRHLVLPRETLWSIAEDRLGSALRWKEVAELNYGVPQPDGGALATDHAILPGWTLALPRVERREVEPDRGSWATTGEESPHPVGGGLSRPPGAGNHQPVVPMVPVVPLGGGVMSAGVATLLDRMRRVQQRYREGGSYIPLPPRSHSRFEQRLRLPEGRAVAGAIDRSLRLLGEVWAGAASDVAPPTVSGVIVRPESIDIMLDRPADRNLLPDGFTPSPDRRWVSVDRNALTSGVNRPRGPQIPLAPLLVTVGQGADGLVLVNLEALGTLLVCGDGFAAHGVVRALALELATSLWSGWFDLTVVGFGSEMERFAWVDTASDVGPLVSALSRHRLDRASRLVDLGSPSTVDARIRARSGSWDPLVVVCGPTTDPEGASELLEVASDPRLGIAVIAEGDPDGASHVLRLSGSARTPSHALLDSVLVPQAVGPEDLSQVAALVDTAMSRRPALASDEPYVNLPIRLPHPPADRIGAAVEDPIGDGRPEAAEPERSLGPSAVRGGERTLRDERGDPLRDERFEVEVAVLGPIEIRGAAREFTRAWAKELVVYLAMHPKGVSNETWATALWPERIMAPSSLYSTASVARRSLGQDRNGFDHLPRSHGRLALAATVGSDWDRFVSLSETGDPDRWRAALELVRGRPFEDVRASDWPILEGIGPAIEAAVVDLSGRLSGACLAAGDPRGAEWAARRGLLVSPYDERLYRMLMRAADLAGNPAGVEAVMAELFKLVATDIEPMDSVHPSTMDLYRSLTRRRIPSAVPRN